MTETEIIAILLTGPKNLPGIFSNAGKISVHLRRPDVLHHKIRGLFFIGLIKMEEIGATASVKPNWSPEQRAFCINKHAETKSYLETQHLFKLEFKTTKSPSKTHIFDWIWRFKKHGTVTN